MDARPSLRGLGAVRNRLGDSHGKGKVAAKPAPRHAELAVNLAGSVALFLLATLEFRPKNDLLDIV
ncbi:abortive infection family protein [Burkholderia cenocepacia]|uniref:abortive infection family protein n=1 Tax=Burkholderia cenocepacia TaxID=95486 RepID=UPI001BA60D56|nr:abortive infection family protein [Burkholderia cenocepacia]